MKFEIKNASIEKICKTQKFSEVFKEAEKLTKELLASCKINIKNNAEFKIIFEEKELGKAGEFGFRAVLEKNAFIVESAHHNRFEKAFCELCTAVFNDGIFAPRSFTPSFDTSTVSYEDFGAAGDGVTNDYYAIKRAHKFANDGGQRVVANAEKTYLISEADGHIPIKTDVDFRGAKLIFDDRYVTAPENKERCGENIVRDSVLFRIENDYPYIRADENMLAEANSKKDKDGYILRGMESGGKSEKFDLNLGYPAFLLIKNSKYYNYIRYGFVGNDGAPQREILVIDENGNIDPDTPMLHDFRDITEIIIMRLDVRPITIKNATIETRASRINHTVNYYIRRNFAFERPHVTFENIHHYVTGEIPRFEPVREDETGLSYSVKSCGFYTKDRKIYNSNGTPYQGDDVKPFLGPAYNGFVHIDITSDVHIKSCTFQSRVLYIEGTYDISGSSANKIVFEDCMQTNFFEKDEKGNDTTVPNMSLCWGVAGTNYCKNMDYIRCRLTRYDAHAGVTNGKIIDSEISVLRLIGGGDFLMSGTKIYARNNFPIQLREDYGASFNGTLTVKDCEIIDAWGSGETVSSLIIAPNAYWDMGYKTFFPNLVIDNIKFSDTNRKEIALVHSSEKVKTERRFPTANVITDRREDPNVPFDFKYETWNPEPWIEKYITAESGKFHGLEYTVAKNDIGTTTILIKDIKNRFPYTPPKFIEVRNNEDNGYQLTLYNSSFFEKTQIRATGTNLVRTDPPKSHF